MKKLFNFLKKIYLLIFSRDYYKTRNDSSKWVFLSYLSEPFYKIGEQDFFLKHQNRRESLILADVFYKLGFNVHVRRFDKPVIFSKRKYDLIFGLEPNFNSMAKRSPDALKIYYATGAFWEYQNNAIVDRTNEATKFYAYEFERRRMSKPHDSCEHADYIFQIGTKNTIETYPTNLRNKIKLIRQTNTTNSINFNIVEKFSKYKKDEFIWFASSGTILKGLDLILPIFKENRNLKLHIVGKLDSDFERIFNNIYSNTSQICYHNFLNVASPKLLEIALNCTFVLFPSCTEGLPGSVLNMMGLGLIPIVSKVCAVDEISKLGYIVDLNSDAISTTIKQCQQLSDQQIRQMMELNFNYVRKNYTMENFEYDIQRNLQSCLL